MSLYFLVFFTQNRHTSHHNYKIWIFRSLFQIHGRKYSIQKHPINLALDAVEKNKPPNPSFWNISDRSPPSPDLHGQQRTKRYFGTHFVHYDWYGIISIPGHKFRYVVCILQFCYVFYDFVMYPVYSTILCCSLCILQFDYVCCVFYDFTKIYWCWYCIWEYGGPLKN